MVIEEDSPFPLVNGFNENCWVIYSAEFPSRLFSINLNEIYLRHFFEGTYDKYDYELIISDLTYKGYRTERFDMNYKNLWKRNMIVRFVNKAAINKI